MNASSPTVFVVDDDAPVRKALTRLLTSAGYHAACFASADEFLAAWNAHPVPGCLLLDVQMPGLNGLQLQQALFMSGRFIPIIFITGHGDIPMSVRAMKSGAVDFFPKPFNDDDLLQAVQEALRRGELERADRDERDAVSKRFATLTPREREVMALVVRGMLNKQIAFELGASEKTIKIHRCRVMAKMQAASVADLVRAAEKIDLPSGPAAPAS
ncbi:MAG: response regulator transcription factor [Desulfobacterales bacterium]|jgi:FixJ family two-component response regulator|nr:response regulator transcription factor [Desulfobacterales bacterium]